MVVVVMVTSFGGGEVVRPLSDVFTMTGSIR